MSKWSDTKSLNAFKTSEVIPSFQGDFLYLRRFLFLSSILKSKKHVEGGLYIARIFTWSVLLIHTVMERMFMVPRCSISHLQAPYIIHWYEHFSSNHCFV